MPATAIDLPGGLFTLRRATAADVTGIVALLADDRLGASRESTDAGQQQPYRRAFALIDRDPAQLLVVVDSAAGRCVGTLQLSFVTGMSRRGSTRATVEAVRVAADLRGGGLGAAMVNWAIAEARERGCALVQLTTDASREAAHRFYRRLGFEPSHLGFKLEL